MKKIVHGLGVVNLFGLALILVGSTIGAWGALIDMASQFQGKHLDSLLNEYDKSAFVFIGCGGMILLLELLLKRFVRKA